MVKERRATHQTQTGRHTDRYMDGLTTITQDNTFQCETVLESKAKPKRLGVVKKRHTYGEPSPTWLRIKW